MKLYLLGSLRNPHVPLLGNLIRDIGFDVFDDWWGASDDADDWWQKHEKIKGRSYQEALYDRYATHIWEFDKTNLDTSDIGVMMHPVGRSAHIELGYLIGQGKPCYIYFDETPERWDVIYRFAAAIYFDLQDMLKQLEEVYNDSQGRGY